MNLYRNRELERHKTFIATLRREQKQVDDSAQISGLQIDQNKSVESVFVFAIFYLIKLTFLI